MKVCTKCRESFPKTSEYFYSCKKTKSGFRSRCIPCAKKINLQTRDKEKARLSLQDWRRKNPDKVREQQKRSSKNRSSSGYYKKYYSENKETINSRRNQWLKETEKSTEYNHKRRSLIKETVTKGDWSLVLEVYGSKCLYPDCIETSITIDHVVPLSRGGRNHISNLQPLCLSHNCSKQSKIEDYRPDQGKQFMEEVK